MTPLPIRSDSAIQTVCYNYPYTDSSTQIVSDTTTEILRFGQFACFGNINRRAPIGTVGPFGQQLQRYSDSTIWRVRKNSTDKLGLRVS